MNKKQEYGSGMPKIATPDFALKMLKYELFEEDNLYKNYPNNYARCVDAIEQALKELKLYKKMEELNNLGVEDNFDELKYLARKEINEIH